MITNVQKKKLTSKSEALQCEGYTEARDYGMCWDVR